MNLRTSSEQHHTAVRSTTSTAPSLNNLVATCTHAFIVTRKPRNCSASEKMRGLPHDLTIPQFTKPHSVPNSPRVYMACVNRMAILQYSSNANDNHCDTCGVASTMRITPVLVFRKVTTNWFPGYGGSVGTCGPVRACVCMRAMAHYGGRYWLSPCRRPCRSCPTAPRSVVLR